MTIESLHKTAADQLQDAGYVHGSREAELFISAILSIDSSTLFNRYEDEVDDDAAAELQAAVKKRLQGQPVAYIVGNQPFMNWKLLVDERALIPRPETEQLAENLVREIRARHLEDGHLLEIGTGAGPIAIALKKFFPQSEITATDISEEALDLAAENAKRHEVEIDFQLSDIFSNLEGQKYDVIVANLPYVPTDRLAFVSEQILDFEPIIAIEAGEDGLQYIKPLIEQAAKHLKKNGLIAIEFWHTHGDPVKDLVEQHLPGYEVEILKDLANFDRFALITPK